MARLTVESACAALLGETGWEAFLAILMRDLPGGAAGFVLHGAGLLRVGPSYGWSEPMRRAYVRFAGWENPWLAHGSAEPVGELRGPRAVMSPAKWRDNLYRRQFLQPHGQVSQQALVLAHLPSGSLALMTGMASEAPPHLRILRERLTGCGAILTRVAAFYGQCEGPGGVFADRMALATAAGIGLMVIAPGLRLLAQSESAARLGLESGLYARQPGGGCGFICRNCRPGRSSCLSAPPISR